MRKLLGSLLVFSLATGCSGARDDSTEKSVKPRSPQHAALLDLVSQQQASQLQKLLMLNGVTIGVVEALPNAKSNAGVTGSETIFTGVRSVKLGAVTNIVVRAPLTVSIKNGPRPAVRTEGMFVFDEDGRLVHQLGGTISSDQLNGDLVSIVSLGTNATWFAIVSSFASDTSNQEDPAMISKVYLLEDQIPLAATVRHSPRDLSYSTHVDLAKGEFPMISFYGSDYSCLKGSGLDGKDHVSGLIWDGDRRVFTGATQVTCHDRLIYRVSLDSSELFSACDSPQPLAGP